MRRCPKCNDVFEDDRVYCTNDGTGLIVEDFGLPSEAFEEEPEEQTVIRAQPIDIKIPSPQPTRQQPEEHQPPAARPVKKETKKKGGCFKYGLVLFAGLLLGGIIVGGAGVAGYLYLQSNKKVVKQEPQKNEPKTDAPERRGPHQAKGESLNESDINGRVIRNNSVLRRSPSNRSGRVATLPRNDRLNIIRRRSPTSAWYRVECEHGAKGWMHGNSIAYIK